MRGQVLAPACGQRVLRLVPSEDLLQVRGAEQGEHRQVLEAVPAVGGRIDQGPPGGGPHQIARPQVAEIGRASCREREYVWVVDGIVRMKKQSIGQKSVVTLATR